VERAARHIAMVAPFGLAPKATTSTRILPLAAALVARGHRVTVLIPPWDDPARSGQRWVEEGVTIRHITLPRRLETLGIVQRLRAALRATAPDLIHVFKPKGHGALAALGLERRWPLVVDTDDWEGAGGWNDSGIYTAPQRALFAWQERSLPRHAAAVTAASRTLQAQLWGFGIARDRVTYLPNGITARRHGDWATARQGAAQVREKLGLGDAPTILLYTRFVEFDPARPVAILRAVRERIPDVRLLIVGHGFHDEEGTLFAAARAAAVSEAIIHLPWAEWSELPAALAVGDVAILPYDDTLINRAKCSIKTLDLMAAARPIVADAVGQSREYLEHNVSGLLVQPEEPAAFGAAVADLLADPARRQVLGNAAEGRAWATFSWEQLVTRVEQLYDRAIARHSNGARRHRIEGE
jgi:glycosyltransferase involved in cell wall biosynthesis